MTNGKLNKKYVPLIWIALLVGCFVRNAYSIYFTAVTAEPTGVTSVFIMVLRILFSYGLIPMAAVFLCALVLWHIGAMRYVRCVPRTDFCYLVMATAAVVKFFVGIIEIFSILEPDIYTVTSTVLEFTFMTGAMIALFFLVIVKQYRLNPVEKYNAFKMWSIVYMVVAGLLVLSQNSAIISILDGSEFGNMVLQMLYEMGEYLNISEIQIGASIAVICIYFAYLIVVIVLGEILRKQSNKFRDPETRGEYYDKFDNRGYDMRNDADTVFNDVDSHKKKKEDEHVFDEFDL